MDKFLVDLDSVLDKLEAEDADRCATDKLDEDDDEPCNLIGSSVYRNADNDKIKKSTGGGSGSGSNSSSSSINNTSGISHLNHPTDYKYQQQQDLKVVKSSDQVTGNSNVIIGDGGGGGGTDDCGSRSCNNKNSNGGSELDSLLSSSQPISSSTLSTNDSLSNKARVIKSQQIDKSETHQMNSSEKSSVTEAQVKTYHLVDDDCKDEPDIISTSNSSEIKGTCDEGIGLIDENNERMRNNSGEKDKDGNLIKQQQPHKLTESLTCYHQDVDSIRIQQSVNLEQTYNNTINCIRPTVSIIKDINEKDKRETVTDYSGLEKQDSSLMSTSTSILQLTSKPIGEKVKSDNKFEDLLLSNHSSFPLPTTSSSPSSSTFSSVVLPKSDLLLDNSFKVIESDSKLEEDKESSTDEEMTEEEVKALEKELESELERLNNQSEVATLEDIIESEIKSTIVSPTETKISSITLSSPLSSKSPSSSTTTTTTTTTNTTTIKATISSPSSSPSTSSSSVTTSSVETSIANGKSVLISQPSESHQSSSSNESNTINDNEASLIDPKEEMSSDCENNINNSSIISSKPIRPATLPLTNKGQQSDQPGHTPMHGDGDGDELVPIETEIETENEVEISSSSSQLTTINNQIDRDTVNENVQTSMPSIGYFKPFWIPDEDAPQCMICDVKFTVMKRRHHCRACGKVLCAQCSRFKAPLAYLSYEKARVCDQCLPLLTEGGIISGQDNSFSDSGYYQVGQQQHPLGAEGPPTPSAPPPHQLTGTAPSSLVTGSTASSGAAAGIGGGGGVSSSSSNIQPVSVLRRPSKPRTGEPKQVIFSDGIRPGNDLKDDQVTSISHRRHAKKVKSPPIEKNPSSPGFTSSSKSRLSKRIVIQDSNGQLPPILNAPFLHSDPTIDNLITLLEKEDEQPVKFSLTKNLMALVKLVKLDCCTNEHCWSFTSQNLSTVGQDEIIVVVEKTTGENNLPRDIFRLFAYIYDSASKGYPFSELSHVLYPDGFFGLKDFPSFVFIRPTFQCLNKLPLPPSPFLIGVLIHRFEVPWAKLFPLRLILRLGSKYNCYPCPVVSYRGRRPSYFEIGHTVMDILADFRNFQYTLPVIPGLTIHTEAKRTTVTFPKNRYDKVMKALGSSNEYVLSFGGTFSLTADSHLTCIQNDDGQYHTQTIKLNGDADEPKLTGASFIVFSGALKSSTGMMAKMSVVEDGLLVQVTANTLNSLKASLKDMNDFIIECGKKDAPTNEESVSIIWGEDDKQFNLGVRSCIDGLSLEGINSIRMYSGTDFEGEKYLIRWVELFLIQNTLLPRSSDGYDAGRAAEIIAQSFCPALVPCLESLVDSKITKIGLRVTLDPDKVGYDVGSNGSPLPSNYINRLDAALIPIIMGNIAPNMEVRLVIELIFYILVK